MSELIERPEIMGEEPDPGTAAFHLPPPPPASLEERQPTDIYAATLTGFLADGTAAYEPAVSVMPASDLLDLHVTAELPVIDYVPSAVEPAVITAPAPATAPAIPLQRESSEPVTCTGPDPDDVPRVINAKTQDEILSFWGSLLGSFGLIWVIYSQFLPFTGRVGFVVLWWIAFMLMYAGITAMGNPRTVVADRAAGAAVRSGAYMVFTALASAILFTFIRGFEALTHVNFFVEDMSGVRPTSSLDHGGIGHAIVGSLIEIGIAVLFALPLGVGTAVFMNEVGGKSARLVRTVVDAMTALPSIVAGLFIYTVLIVTLGVSRSGFAAACAIFVMILPIIARASDVVLRVMPGGLREASLALGASKWQTVRKVVLPTVRPGLATALILGIARGVGETSPVLLTSGATTFYNFNPFDGPMNSLPLFVFTAVRSGEPLYIARGFGAAAVLLALVLLLFVVTRFLARTKVGSR